MNADRRDMQPVVTADANEITVNVVDLFRALFQKAWALGLALVIGAAAAGIFTKFFVTPQYQATSMIYIYTKSTSITSITDLQIGSQLAVDFQIVGTSREVMDSVIARLGLDTDYKSLLETVEISSPSGSHILKIEATNPDPQLAASISNAIADELRARIASVMNTDEPSTLSRAYVPEHPVSPSLAKNVVLGGFGLMFLLAIIFTVAFILDDTVKSEEDVKKYLGVNVLAEIVVERGQKSKQAG